MSAEWFRSAPRVVVHVAVVPFEGLFARKLRESLYVVSRDLAADGEEFAVWASPILRLRVEQEVAGLS